jgi:RNase adapter protein RapZ
VAEFLIITGMSGAGRSQAGATLEDLGWFVIDNMPTALITKVADLIAAPGSTTDQVALVVGRDTEQLDELEAAVQQLRSGGSVVRMLFLEASDEVLVRRFEGTRRRHPLGREGVTDAIARERKRLEPIRALADVVVDTTDLNVNQLRERLIDLFTVDRGVRMQISVVSFGFKHGVPLDVDNVFDARFLPNPHWIEELRPLTGLDEPVRNYVLCQPEAREFVSKVDDLLGFLIPAYVKEGKAYLTVAVGCTGGRHRSVALVEELAARIRSRGFDPAVYHRDLTR